MKGKLLLGFVFTETGVEIQYHKENLSKIEVLGLIEIAKKDILNDSITADNAEGGEQDG